MRRETMMDMMVCVTKMVDDLEDEYVTECDGCSYYNRGECSRTGEPMHPEDYCSKAVKAD